MEAEFSQKRINHIFHYTRSFDSLIGVLQKGFSPSYCQEQITDLVYLIPMVSFCNISIRDVDLYMRYGNYGIGMSIDWAIKNRISPVIYIHETSPFNSLHRDINKILLWDLVNGQFADAQRQFQEAMDKGKAYNYTPPADERHIQLLSNINMVTVPALQFFKNWKVDYKGQQIITYQEREWRYIPDLKDEKKIIPSSDDEFAAFNDKDAKPKPHLPQYSLQIDNITDLRYIIISNEDERSNVIDCLKGRFGEKDVLDALFRGTLLILTDNQVRNDF